MKKAKWLEKVFLGQPTKIGYASTPEEFIELQRLAGLSHGEMDNWCCDGRTLAMMHYYDGVIIVCSPLSACDSTLVHEAVHVFQRMMLDIGEPQAGHEIEAYFIQAISEQLIKARDEKRALLHKTPKARVSTKPK